VSRGSCGHFLALSFTGLHKRGCGASRSLRDACAYGKRRELGVG
jgi:hypothetical protein